MGHFDSSIWPSDKYLGITFYFFLSFTCHNPNSVDSVLKIYPESAIFTLVPVLTQMRTTISSYLDWISPISFVLLRLSTSYVFSTKKPEGSWENVSQITTLLFLILSTSHQSKRRSPNNCLQGWVGQSYSLPTWDHSQHVFALPSLVFWKNLCPEIWEAPHHVRRTGECSSVCLV